MYNIQYVGGVGGVGYAPMINRLILSTNVHQTHAYTLTNHETWLTTTHIWIIDIHFLTCLLSRHIRE
jgi:hypothetical protein